MVKKFGQIIMVFLGIALVAGCSSTKTTVRREPNKEITTTKRMETRFYVEDRQREDQSMEGGNYGYIVGTPVRPDRSNIKKTRKVYVVEVTKNVDEAINMQDVKIEPYVPAPRTSLPPIEKRKEASPEWSKPVAIPDLNTVERVEKESYMEEYVIQEGDTLQKISKKFYDSYGKWTQIYEVNKAVIKDPNRIRPGTRIQIPMN